MKVRVWFEVVLHIIIPYARPQSNDHHICKILFLSRAWIYKPAITLHNLIICFFFVSFTCYIDITIWHIHTPTKWTCFPNYLLPDISCFGVSCITRTEQDGNVCYNQLYKQHGKHMSGFTASWMKRHLVWWFYCQ